jgi:Asp/Glu/hydantoin racemase
VRQPRIVLLHATTVAMEPISHAMAEGWPEAEPVSLLDEALSLDRARAGGDESFFNRFEVLGKYALNLGASGILATCSAFGPALTKLDALLPIPVVKPNEPMFRAALGTGRRIAMLATFAPAVASMEQEFSELAAELGLAASLETVIVAGAIDALRAGRAEEHNDLVARAAAGLTGTDAVMLAHFSTSRASAQVQAASAIPVLSAPESAVRAIRARVEERVFA